MGQKVRPTGIRIGITRNWSSRWYATKRDFGRYLLEDSKIRRHVKREFYSAGVSSIDIERDLNRVTVTITVARPGVVIGRKGARIEELKRELEAITVNRAVNLNIQEVPDPEIDAQLIAENMAEQLKKRQPFRRVIKQAIKTARDRGVPGIKVMISGRLGGAELARTEHAAEGSIPLSTLRANIDYGFAEAFTTYGVIGVKVWVFKGEILKEKEIKRHGADAEASQA